MLYFNSLGYSLAGIDLTKPPSMMTTIKLGADKNFREAIQDVLTQMSAAGIDVTKKVRLCAICRRRS